MGRSLPLARQQGVVAQELSGELLVYDLEREKVHCLNPAAALVWRHCDGKRSVGELATLLHERLGLPEDERMVQLALESLAKVDLLAEGRAAMPDVARPTRRQLMKRLGVGLAALPFVATIASPQAHAGANATCLGKNRSCGPTTLPCCPPLTCINDRCG